LIPNFEQAVITLVQCFELLFGNIASSTASAVALRELALLNHMHSEGRLVICEISILVQFVGCSCTRTTGTLEPRLFTDVAMLSPLVELEWLLTVRAIELLLKGFPFTFGDIARVQFIRALGARIRIFFSCFFKASGTDDTVTLLAAGRQADNLTAKEALQGLELRLLCIQAEQRVSELKRRVFDICEAQQVVTLSICRLLPLVN
jgi:hypothetical protein